MIEFPILLLAILTGSVVFFGLANPKNIIRFDVATSLIILVWLIPQQISIQNDIFAAYYDLDTTFYYIVICFVALLLGHWLAIRNNSNATFDNRHYVEEYNSKKLARAAMAMVALGGAAFILMARESVNFGVQEQWSGIITFYYLLSQFLMFGGILGIIVYTRYRERGGLYAYLLLIAIAVPVFFLLVRRSVLFQIVAVTIASLIFNKNLKIPRTFAVAGIVIGALILNSAGAIRSHVFYEGGTVFTAFTEGAVFEGDGLHEGLVAGELKSAVSDIEIARITGNYRPFQMLWNIAVSQYIPGFIVGDELKASLLIDMSNKTVMQDYSLDGSTRTGFAEAYSGYWYFGTLIYFALGWIYGRLWLRSNMSSPRSQYLYLAFLLYALLTVTESISRLVVTAPIILISTWLAFGYAKFSTARRGQVV